VVEEAGVPGENLQQRECRLPISHLRFRVYYIKCTFIGCHKLTRLMHVLLLIYCNIKLYYLFNVMHVLLHV
jgi:hypothetical protein